MADLKLDRLHLQIMEHALPVGMAMVDRVKKGGVRHLLELFSDSQAPLEDLRQEGDEAAIRFRDQLDSVSPGLGNPVVNVDVGIETPSEFSMDFDDQKDLVELLLRIEKRLNSLQEYLDERDTDISSATKLKE